LFWNVDNLKEECVAMGVITEGVGITLAVAGITVPVEVAEVAETVTTGLFVLYLPSVL
jgi:basic membrane lipoprotein Med (substrate-binding protein (PBP1-ABC) superfamily)